METTTTTTTTKSVLSTTGLIQGEVLTFWGNILLVISEVFYCYIPPCTPLLSHVCILLSCFLKHFYFNLDFVEFLFFPVACKLSLWL